MNEWTASDVSGQSGRVAVVTGANTRIGFETAQVLAAPRPELRRVRVTRLLGFDLLPRIKQVNHCKLYLPAAGDLERYPRLRPALTNPIKWDLIEQRTT